MDQGRDVGRAGEAGLGRRLSGTLSSGLRRKAM